MQRLYGTKGFDINAELDKYSTRYALEIDGMTESEQRQYLLEELTADSMFGVFASKKAVELYARKQPKDAKKVAKAISNFLAKVRSALETLAFKGLGSVSALQQQYDTLDEISRQFFAALEEARINRQQNKNTAESGSVEIQKSKKIDKENKSQYNKKTTYNEQRTLFYIWSNSESTPIGEQRTFKLQKQGAWHLYEKTEEGAVDLGIVKQIGKRSNLYETADRKRIDKTYEHDGPSGSSGGRINRSDRLGGLRPAHEGSDGDLPSVRFQYDDVGSFNSDVQSNNEVQGHGLRRNSARITSETEAHNEILRESDVSNSDFIDRMSLKDYNNRGWAYSLLTAEDIRLFNERVSETMRNGSQSWSKKLKDGTKVLEINNKVLFVSGTFSNPVIEFVVAFNAESATEFEILQETFFGGMQYGNYSLGRLTGWFSFNSDSFQNEFVRYYNRRNFIADSATGKGKIQRASLPDGFASYGYFGTVRNGRGISEQDEGEIPGIHEGQIKYSNKISSDTADYVSRLQQENEELQAELEAAKAELKETRGLTISDSELHKIANHFADTLQSDLTRDELFTKLQGIFRYTADGGDLNVALGTMTDLYMDAMQTSHSEMLWTQLYDDAKEFRTDLRTNPVYLSEIQAATVESNFDGYKNFQRASFGKIRFVKNHDGNHATLDTRWSEQEKQVKMSKEKQMKILAFCKIIC